MFVNAKSSTSAKTFTLAHELAHLVLGETGVDDATFETRVPATDAAPGIERWCNEFAAEFLVPLADLSNSKPGASGDRQSDANVLARRFKVSTLVVLRRMWDAGWFATWDAYRDVYEAEADRLVALDRTGASGGSFVRTQTVRLGRRFTRAVAASVAEGRTSLREAMGLTATKTPKSFDALARWIDGGA